MISPGQPTMSPQSFVAKWRDVDFGEKQASQEMFLDICHLVGHPTPVEYGNSEAFTFEKWVPGGFADAYLEGCFGWEFKGSDSDLPDGLNQLLRYQVHLKTPPLLIVSSFHTIWIQTNFQGRETVRRVIPITDLVLSQLGIRICLRKGPIELCWLVGSVDGGGGVMVRDKYAVRLAQEEREELQRLVRVGKNSARVTARARIIIKSDDGWAAPQVAEALDVALGTVYQVKQRFAEERLEKVLQDRPQANRPRKLDDRGEAHLIALACSPAPEGHARWTLRLLAGKVVELGLASSMSHEGIRKRLKKTLSSRGRRRSGAFPR